MHSDKSKHYTIQGLDKGIYDRKRGLLLTGGYSVGSGGQDMQTPNPNP